MDFEDQFCGVKGPEGRLCFLGPGHPAHHSDLDVIWGLRPDEDRPSGRETQPEAINNALRRAVIAMRQGKR